MDKFRKAFELAQQDGQVSPLLTEAKGIQNAGSAPKKPIRYSKTRVIRPDNALLARNRIITSSTDPAAVAPYRVLRTKVLQHMAAKNWSTLAITSPRGNEGKTVTAVNLAISIAREINYTVLLVDLDLRRPSVHRYMGLDPTHGIVDHLLDDIPLSGILCNPSIDGFCVAPGRESVENSSELLSSPRLARLIQELTARYRSRIILFDLPPVLLADDVLAFSPSVDAVLLTIEEGKTTREDVKRSLETLGATPILGTVLNKSTENPNRYY
jgi:capsular exopolysaccharide synthesis family protein